MSNPFDASDGDIFDRAERWLQALVASIWRLSLVSSSRCNRCVGAKNIHERKWQSGILAKRRLAYPAALFGATGSDSRADSAAVEQRIQDSYRGI